jgi:hypothetical protein
MSSVKIFPKSRVCVINAFPSFVEGLKQAVKFTKDNNLALSSPDGRRIIYGFCLKIINNLYKNTKSPYPKVLCLSVNADNEKFLHFIENHFDSIIGKMPIPYCGRIDFNSPELENAAEASLEKQKNRRSFEKMTDRLNLRRID